MAGSMACFVPSRRIGRAAIEVLSFKSFEGVLVLTNSSVGTISSCNVAVVECVSSGSSVLSALAISGANCFILGVASLVEAMIDEGSSEPA